MKLAAVVVLVVACKGGDKPADQPSGEPAKPSGGGPAPTKPSVTGELVVSGAMDGTFRWKDDLALFCIWIPDLKEGAIDVTMTDGKDAFIAVQAHAGNNTDKLVFTSGKLKSASMLVAKTGVTITGSDDRTQVSATIDGEVASKEGTKATIKGKLDARCPP